MVRIKLIIPPIAIKSSTITGLPTLAQA